MSNLARIDDCIALHVRDAMLADGFLPLSAVNVARQVHAELRRQGQLAELCVYAIHDDTGLQHICVGPRMPSKAMEAYRLNIPLLRQAFDRAIQQDTQISERFGDDGTTI